MNSAEKPGEEPSKGTERGEHEKNDDTVLNSVARSVGTAIGVIASTATKVIGEPHATEPAPETKSKPEKARKTPKKAVRSADAENKHLASRLTKKKKKRAAHRKKLKRSNTKG